MTRAHGDAPGRHRRPVPDALRRMGEEAFETAAQRLAQIRPSAMCTFAVSNWWRLAYDFHSLKQSSICQVADCAGADASAAALIGEVCSRRRVHTATFVIRAASTTDEALSKTLAQVRPWSLMVVIANDDDCVEDILRSFR